MIKRILVPVDGSQTAEAALQMAIGLGNEMGAEARLALVREVSDQHPPYSLRGVWRPPCAVRLRRQTWS